jgi:hypothetical protein
MMMGALIAAQRSRVRGVSECRGPTSGSVSSARRVPADLAAQAGAAPLVAADARIGTHQRRVSVLAADRRQGYRFRSYDLRRRSTEPALFCRRERGLGFAERECRVRVSRDIRYRGSGVHMSRSGRTREPLR